MVDGLSGYHKMRPGLTDESLLDTILSKSACGSQYMPVNITRIDFEGQFQGPALETPKLQGFPIRALKDVPGCPGAFLAWSME